jgi:hypothetical protein
VAEMQVDAEMVQTAPPLAAFLQKSLTVRALTHCVRTCEAAAFASSFPFAFCFLGTSWSACLAMDLLIPVGKTV